MFPFLTRDVPHVEEKILSYLGPTDLIRSKRVSKKWDMVIQKRIDHLKRTNDIHALIQMGEESMKAEYNSLQFLARMSWSFLGGIVKIISFAMTGQSDWVIKEFVKEFVKWEGLALAFCDHFGQGCLCMVGNVNGIRKVVIRFVSTDDDDGIRIENGEE